jgi:HSP20 family protein
LSIGTGIENQVISIQQLNIMTHIKFRPARELLRDSMVPGNFLNAFDSFFNEQAGKFERNTFFTPRTDVVENAKSFMIHITLPGLKKEEVSIHVDGDVLKISGERKLNNEDKENKFHLVESLHGKFSRNFNLPENADKQNIEAELVDGILTLTIAKVEVKETKTAINIK